MKLQSIAARILILPVLAGILGSGGCRGEKRQTLTLGVPTTVQDSGLLDALLPEFEHEHPGYRVRFVAAGSGELLALGARGDVDVLLSHSPRAERRFMETGLGVLRRRVMENDFLVVGPPMDPAGIHDMSDAARALARIAAAAAPFISRGDDSGTHRKELALREAAGLAAEGAGYSEAGQGMGAVLRAASETAAYTLCDRATFMNLSRSLDLVVLVAGDPRLLNVYHVIVPAQLRERQGARVFADWLVSADAQQLIGGYGVERFGTPVYTPSAGRGG